MENLEMHDMEDERQEEEERDEDEEEETTILDESCCNTNPLPPNSVLPHEISIQH